MKRQQSQRVLLDVAPTRKASPKAGNMLVPNTPAAMSETGTTGYRYIESGSPLQGSWIIDDRGNRLSQRERVRLYREMGMTPVFGTAMLIFRMLLSQIDYKVQPRENSKDQQRVKLADFANECLTDMSVPLEATAWEQWSCLQYGHAEFEVIFKERRGADPGYVKDARGFSRPIPSSNFTDGKIGLDRLAYRAPETIDRWILNANAGVEGVVQIDPNTHADRTVLPSWKVARFVFGYTGSPQGDSIFNSCISVYPLWKRIHEAEAVGATRRLQGTPTAYAPSAWMASSAKADQKDALRKLDDTLKNLTLSHDARLIVPSIFDKDGNRELEVSLLSLEGVTGIDTSAIIDRIEQRMSSALMVSLMLLGQGKSGTQALAKEQNKLLLDCLNALGHFRARVLTDVLRTLIRLNGWPETEAPECVAQSLKTIPDFTELCEGIAKVSSAGFMQSPDSVLSAELRSRAGVAPPKEGEGDEQQHVPPLEDLPPDPNNPNDPNNPPDPNEPPAPKPEPKTQPKPKPAPAE